MTGTSDDRAQLGRSTERVQTEASWLPRFVALLTPFFAAAAAWVAAWIADHTGVQLDEAQIALLMVAVATSALAASWKWLSGWQQHERLVAQGLTVPVKRGDPAPLPPPTVAVPIMGMPPDVQR
jgi:hypothetical protein